MTFRTNIQLMAIVGQPWQTHTHNTLMCAITQTAQRPVRAQSDRPHTDMVANQEQMLTIIIHFWGGAEQRDELKLI